MKEKDLIFDPTLYTNVINGSEWSTKFVKQANEMGVKICAVTDYTNDLNKDFPYLFDEMGIYAEKWGFTPQQVLLSATKIAAEALGAEHEVGTVAKGKTANRLILNGNSLNNIKQLRAVGMVLKRGKIVLEYQ